VVRECDPAVQPAIAEMLDLVLVDLDDWLYFECRETVRIFPVIHGRPRGGHARA
jgi:hypothetical protein